MATHHLFYPSTVYETPLEQSFRELPSNKLRICRNVEAGIHEADPNGPPKPTIEVMAYCVEQDQLRRELEGRRP